MASALSPNSSAFFKFFSDLADVFADVNSILLATVLVEQSHRNSMHRLKIIDLFF
jgi:hypothetical protein